MRQPAGRTIASLMALGVSLIAIRSADAHAVYMTYTRHDVRVTVSPENIDITVVDQTLKELAEQGDDMLKRVELAQKIYEKLQQTAKKELEIRQ